MDSPGLVIVDDDLDFATMCARTLEAEGYRAQAVGSAQRALQVLVNPDWQALLADIRMPGMTGLELLQQAKRARPELTVILMTGYGTLETAISALRAGACDMLTKPFDVEELLQTVRRHLGSSGAPQAARPSSHRIVGQSQAMRHARERIEIAASTTSNVLILGASGTGKELVARSIHEQSARAAAPFVAVNCAALPADLIESELFGHKKGAFSGATRDAVGLFRAADGGSLFLDEVFEMPGSVQAKFLRALEDFRIRPVGSVDEFQVDVRIIAATNRDVAEMQKARDFRHDLFYRLSVLRFEMPSLKERLEDLPLLVSFLIEELNRRFGRKVRGLSSEALGALYAHDWPGNVRELRNSLESAFALSRNAELLELEHFALAPTNVRAQTTDTPRPGATPDEFPPLDETLGRVEREWIVHAIDACGGNKSKAAELLQISRKRIYRKLEEYGIPLNPRDGS